MAQGALPGFRDFYPDVFAERAHIMQAWRRVAGLSGFVEYDGPPLEPLDLYTRKSGEEIVGQLYEFTDRGGREVALRPEMTPTFARMVGARVETLRKPVRWFSTPQLFRYERAQRGRLREHFQLNVDIVGETDVLADAELVAVACGVCAELGLTSGDVRVRYSDRRLLNAILAAVGITPAQLPAVYAVVDKLDREPREKLAARLADAGVDHATGVALFEVCAVSDIEALRGRGGAEVSSLLDELGRFAAAVTALGYGDWLQFDMSIVRGLAYYTGIVFELFDARGELRAICGGGRYDTLLATLGGVDMPALGFGMGDVVLAELLRDRGLMPAMAAAVDTWVVAGEGVEPAAVLHMASRLRAAGIRTEFVLSEEKLRTQRTGNQLKAARKAGAATAVVVLPDGTVEFRSGSGESSIMPEADVASAILRSLHPGSGAAGRAE